MHIYALNASRSSQGSQLFFLWKDIWDDWEIRLRMEYSHQFYPFLMWVKSYLFVVVVP